MYGHADKKALIAGTEIIQRDDKTHFHAECSTAEPPSDMARELIAEINVNKMLINVGEGGANEPIKTLALPAICSTVQNHHQGFA